MDEEKLLNIALFRFSLIAPLLHLKRDEDEDRLIRTIANKMYEIPYSKKKRLSRKTIRNYFKAYQVCGFTGLKPKIRNDKYKSRKITGDLLQEIIRLKKEEPRRSVLQVIKLTKQNDCYSQICIRPRTVSRIFYNLGLNRLKSKTKKIYRSFEMEHINELWETDICDGIYLQSCKKRTYLFAFLDDHSRLIPHAQFYFDEKLPRLEDCLKKAILKRGLPKAIYCDNGKIFVSKHLRRICAELGIRLVHHLPYSPQSKGKIERVFLRIQKEFFVEAEGAGVSSLGQLNSYFWAWLEVSYHRTEHHSTGKTPLDRYIEDMKKTEIRKVESLEEITEVFLYREIRKVSESGVISLYKNHYRVNDLSLLGKKIEVRYDPFDLTRVFIYSDNQFKHVAYPKSLKRKALQQFPAENRKTVIQVRKSSVDFFLKLKQKEMELNRTDSGRIDFTLFEKGDVK